MAKQIGIVAVSAEGAALCYHMTCVEGASLLGHHARRFGPQPRRGRPRPPQTSKGQGPCSGQV
jgi:hypothetical protein